MTNNLKEDKIPEDFKRYLGSSLANGYYLDDDAREKQFERIIERVEALINQKEKESEVRALHKLSKHYDSLEQSHTKDFEGNEIATWSGYKHFRNPITDRIEELIGVRDDKSIYEWLDRIKQLKEELKGGTII